MHANLSAWGGVRGPAWGRHMHTSRNRSELNIFIPDSTQPTFVEPRLRSHGANQANPFISVSNR